MEFILAKYAALPPGIQESATVTHKLDECCGNALQTNLDGLVPDARVGEDKQRIEQYWKPWSQAQPVPAMLWIRPWAIYHKHTTYEGHHEQTCYAHGEYHWQHVYELHCSWMAFLKVYAGNTAVINLTPELAEVGTALVPYPCRREEACLVPCLYDAV